MDGEEQAEDGDDVDDEDADEIDDDRRGARPRRSRSRSAACRCTPITVVTDAEREIGQRLVIDLRLDVGESDATVTDRVEDTVDYAEVCQLVALVAQQRSHQTLERLCSTIADRLLDDFELEACGSRRPSPSRRSRCAWRRSRSRSGGRPSERRGYLPGRRRAERHRGDLLAVGGGRLLPQPRHLPPLRRARGRDPPAGDRLADVRELPLHRRAGRRRDRGARVPGRASAIASSRASTCCASTTTV